jgi:hypothetical protein
MPTQAGTPPSSESACSQRPQRFARTSDPAAKCINTVPGARKWHDTQSTSSSEHSPCPVDQCIFLDVQLEHALLRRPRHFVRLKRGVLVRAISAKRATRHTFIDARSDLERRAVKARSSTYLPGFNTTNLVAPRLTVGPPTVLEPTLARDQLDERSQRSVRSRALMCN